MTLRSTLRAERSSAKDEPDAEGAPTQEEHR
jgi:hypothetical protein